MLNDPNSEVLTRFANRSVGLKQVFIEICEEWEPKLPPPYLVMAEYAEQLTKEKMSDIQTVSSILVDVENYLANDGPAADLVAVGFLEALLGRASSGRFNFAMIVHLLGPKSLEFCKSGDQFTGCSTVLDAENARRQ